MPKDKHGWADGDDRFWQIINKCEEAPIPRIAFHHALQSLERLTLEKAQEKILSRIEFYSGEANKPLRDVLEYAAQIINPKI